MHIEDVSLEVLEALRTINGLRTPVWGATSIDPPAALVALPDRLEYDLTYGRGADRIPDLWAVILVGAPEDRTSRKRLSAYADGSGPSSVKQVLEGWSWRTCDTVTVKYAEFAEDGEFAGVPLLAAIFHLDIVGSGA